MRRVLAIAITLLLGFDLTAPLFAVNSAANLPACCRRNGAHHCAGGVVERASSTHAAFAPRCPDFPKAIATLQRTTGFAPVTFYSVSPLFVHPSAPPQIAARHRVACLRNRHKRGPPAIAL